jgi:hypothetical protein
VDLLENARYLVIKTLNLITKYSLLTENGRSLLAMLYEPTYS